MYAAVVYSWAMMDHEELLDATHRLAAFCARYGGFPMPFVLDADLSYLRRYASQVAELIKEEGRKKTW